MPKTEDRFSQIPGFRLAQLWDCYRTLEILTSCVSTARERSRTEGYGPIDLVMNIGIRQIGTVHNELRGNNRDGLDLGPTKPRSAFVRDMLWTHHWGDEHDRCAHVGGRLVCRRCLVLYPVTIAVLILARFGVRWPGNLDTMLLFALPLPLVLDFVLEHMGYTRYSPRRQLATTFLGAISLGHAFARYLEHNNDPLFWSMVGWYGGLCAGSLVVHHLRDRRSNQQRDAELEAADPLVNGFVSRDEMLTYLGQ